MAETASRMALESALCLYAPRDRQGLAKTFLEALSVDELLFLAEFLGACILIGSVMDLATGEAIRQRANAFRGSMERMNARRRDDMSHKLILVTEFAACCGFSVR